MAEKKKQQKPETKRAFNLPKQYKMAAANYLDPHERGAYIRAMINALQTEQDWKNRRRQVAEKTDDV